MVGLSLIYIAAYVVPIYLYPLSARWSRLLEVVALATWLIFIVDYVVQLSLARDKRHFLKKEWFALALVAFPFLRPIRAIRGLLFIRQATSENRSILRELPWVLGVLAILLIVIAGASVLSAERFAPGATIRTPSDALWWAVSSTTSSSSGNLSPVTIEGRIVATILRLFGLGLFTSMAGLIAAWFMTYFHFERFVARPDESANESSTTGEQL